MIVAAAEFFRQGGHSHETRDSAWASPPICQFRPGSIETNHYARCSGSDTYINEPRKRAQSVLKIPSAFRARWRKPQIDTGTRIPDLTRYKDRISLGNITDARRHLHRRTEKIVALIDRFAGMYTDPYTDRGLADFVV
jgi:hypothetical protein